MNPKPYTLAPEHGDSFAKIGIPVWVPFTARRLVPCGLSLFVVSRFSVGSEVQRIEEEVISKQGRGCKACGRDVIVRF